ncbi:hypothetical protein D8B26_008236 [Coccidioides posadasii str. Silveira]|uniref:Uncharacterized protein n=3 Tax=Coccidioides posadasii TaxID=199306 RepID=E9DGL5_COCPS|nr:hypothetical protein CPC735_043560 [Coccidioides posadasii C735 delta SOWgp]EER25912.1 hypothetical protein CPC735_043560 [Coccidioides posadasii C735 delta SOWgp]EFW14376.1 conserved hypothetical protein [Coccidioides posadasii str. Silveira]KMM69632.1 hypothetical protein CPAG_05946 [Coccidioides posadasii RMSCC 3488]QVM13628.1 hypothetical protein D8B26_008236 [Coccidioides posadasii str. Silveira]|eukprot:XP_003068057.1 hypothetical protein CPC735_043560 [Coccidioides posadasii C735 delta SOWgp]
MSDTADWLSAVSSLTATAIAVATLFTVYIAAVQLASQNRRYRLGLSWRSLGRWQNKVAQSSFLGLQRRVYTPSVSVPSLVQNRVVPCFTFPRGIPKEPDPDIESASGLVPAGASWVGLMEALGLRPDDDFLEMQDASELVNGIVAMHWKGKDFVAVCSMLGFQSYENHPSFSSPMPLPMLWHGPLGWMQLQPSPQGCIAQFRSRATLFEQISDDLHRYWRKETFSLPSSPFLLQARLWASIGGLLLPDGKALYLGGADFHKRPVDIDDDHEFSPAELHQYLTSADLSPDELRRVLLGKQENRGRELRREIARSKAPSAQRVRDEPIPDSRTEAFESGERSFEGKQQVLRPCPGLLSVCVQGEIAYSRGLDIRDCHEFDRKFASTEDVDRARFPYSLGKLQMDRDTLMLMKSAFLYLGPDGFYFAPSYLLCSDVREVYRHIEEQSNKLKRIFPITSTTPTSGRDYLYHAMKLCNDLQQTRKMARATYSVEDMRLLAKASNNIAPFISPDKAGHGKDPTTAKPEDLIWAMLVCPELSSNIRESLTEMNLQAFLDAKVECEDGVLTLPDLSGLREMGPKYKVPLVANGDFTGQQLLAALIDIFIRYFWIDKAWPTDVAAYDMTMPQTVAMC